MSFPSPPGFPRTGLGNTGLGAVGGARGVGAGAARVLVEFVMAYDKGRLEAISADLKKLQEEQVANMAAVNAATQKQVLLEDQLNKARAARALFDKQYLPELQAVLDIQKKAVAEQTLHGKVTAQTVQEYQNARLVLQRTSGLSEEQLSLLLSQAAVQRQLTAAAQQTAAADQRREQTAERLLLLEREQAAARQATQGAAGRLGALGLGLIGGTIGGAIVGSLALEPLQAVVDAFKKSLTEIIDPASAAKEAVKSLAEEVNQLADSEDISRLEAAGQILERIAALRGPEVDNEVNQHLLERVGLNEAIAETLTLQNDIMRAQRGEAGALTEVLRAQYALANGFNPFDPWVVASGVVQGNVGGILAAQQAYNDAAGLAIPDLQESQRLTEDRVQAELDAADAARETADAIREIREEAASAAIEAASAARIEGISAAAESTMSSFRRLAEADIDAISARATAAVNSVQNAANAQISRLQDQMGDLELQPSRRTRGLERQLDALNDAGPSRRTNQLAAAIERLNRAEERREFRQRLADIDEQRRLILLRRRLDLTQREIDLDKFRGEDRLVAIDALLDRMQKQNEEQDRFNKLLDIQYQMGQRVERQQGETIQEFIERRAQHYRDLLQQQGDIEQDRRRDSLEEERDRVQESIDLKDLEEQRRELIEQRAHDRHMARLRERLERSQEADREALESRRESLQKQLEASKKADQEALESAREALQDRIEAIRQNTAETIQKINQQRDADIRAREEARDRDLEIIEKRKEEAINAEKERTRQLLTLVSKTETERRKLALAGAEGLAEVAAVAGRVAGSEYSYNLLLAEIRALGLDSAQARLLLENAGDLRASYLAAMRREAAEQFIPGFSGIFGGGRAEGGIWRVHNGMQPMSRDIRSWGEEGDETMVLLSNRVTQAIKQSQGGGSLVGGDFIVQGTGDPWRDRYQMERRMKEIAEETMRRN